MYSTTVRNYLKRLLDIIQIIRYISIPLDNDGDYVSCERYDLNYSSYSIADLINWDRSVMVDNTTATVSCDDWVYDQSIFRSTIISRVGWYINIL